MNSALDRTVRGLGEGSLVPLGSGQVLFKLDSYQANPVVTPQQLGLTWQVDGEPRIGAVFNGGAELFEDKVILLPRCHRDYRESTFFDKRLGAERRCLDNYVSEVWPLLSEDGVHFARLADTAIRGDGTDHIIMPPGSSDEDYRRSSPSTYVTGGFPPTVLLHATSDTSIPFEASMRLFQKLRDVSVPVELHVFEGLSHVFDRHPEFAEPAAELCDLFLDRHVINPRVYPHFQPTPVR